MKLYKVLTVALAGFALIACSDIDTQIPESGTMLATQVQETNLMAPSRAEASFSGLFSSIGQSAKMYSTPDDWQFLMINFCNDLEGADALIADSGYNWFSVCGELSSRNANYRNPSIRYRAPYSMIANVNTFILSYPEDVSDPKAINMIAQAKALRAYSYLTLAPSFQFAYEFAADKPCVPLVTESFPEDFTNNPRATVREVFEQIISDLDYAVEHLEGASRTSKAYIDGSVAHGLRARAYLYMGEWAKALADAQAAASGYTPASLADVSKPYFMDIKEGCWIWGYDMTVAIADVYPYATTSSWLRSFSANGYAPATQCYTCINKLLYDSMIGIHITQAAPGRKDFRKAVGKYGMAGLIVSLNRLQFFPTVSQITVRIVLKNDDIILAAKLGQLYSPIQRKGLPCWVLERGNHIDHLGMIFQYFLFHVLRYNTLIIGFASDALRLKHFENFNTMDKCRRLAENDISRVDENLTKQIHGFQAAVNN